MPPLAAGLTALGVDAATAGTIGSIVSGLGTAGSLAGTANSLVQSATQKSPAMPATPATPAVSSAWNVTGSGGGASTGGGTGMGTEVGMVPAAGNNQQTGIGYGLSSGQQQAVTSGTGFPFTLNSNLNVP